MCIELAPILVIKNKSFKYKTVFLAVLCLHILLWSEEWTICYMLTMPS